MFHEKPFQPLPPLSLWQNRQSLPLLRIIYSLPHLWLRVVSIPPRPNPSIARSITPWVQALKVSGPFEAFISIRKLRHCNKEKISNFRHWLKKYNNLTKIHKRMIYKMIIHTYFLKFGLLGDVPSPILQCTREGT